MSAVRHRGSGNNPTKKSTSYHASQGHLDGSAARAKNNLSSPILRRKRMGHITPDGWCWDIDFWRGLSPTLSSMMRHWIFNKLVTYCANLALTGVLVSNHNASWHICCEGYFLAKIPRTTMGNWQFMRWRCNPTQGRIKGGQGVPKTAHYRLQALIVCTLVQFPPHLTPRNSMRCSRFRRARNVLGDFWVAPLIGLNEPWVIFDWVVGVEFSLWRILCHWISAAVKILEINLVL